MPLHVGDGGGGRRRGPRHLAGGRTGVGRGERAGRWSWAGWPTSPPGLCARRRAWRPVVIWTLVVAGTAYGAWLIVQYRYLAPPDVKVAALDAIGRAVSAPFPQLVPWAPFANSSATLLEGLVVVAAGLALGRGSAVMRGAAAARRGRDGGWRACSPPRVAPGWRSRSALAVLVAYRYIARWQVAIAAVAGCGRAPRRRRRHGGRRHALVDPLGRRGRASRSARRLRTRRGAAARHAVHRPGRRRPVRRRGLESTCCSSRCRSSPTRTT